MPNWCHGKSFLLPYRRCYFTNAQRAKNDDPYALLGLEWGATTSDIKAAYRKAAAKLHPDTNSSDPKATAKFQRLNEAYRKLTENPMNADDTGDWRMSVWRQGDRLATDRTDVAGQLKKRPIPPAQTDKGIPGYSLGQLSKPRGEYLGTKKTSRVGNKWVTPRPYKAWKRGPA